MRKLTLALLLILGFQSGFGVPPIKKFEKDKVQEDTLYVEVKTDIVVVSSVKETNSLKNLPAAVSILSPKRLDAMQVNSLKDLSSFIPNYSAADYGSKMTAPLYIRGIGARSGMQTVSMYVDNVPYFNTTAFDTELLDIQRVEVLRGTQSTLYGRNTMGGIINVFTYSPLDVQGTKASVGGGSYGLFNVQASHLRKLGENVGVAVGAYYNRHDGFFKNHDEEGNVSERVDHLRNAGGYLKFAWQITPKFKANYSVRYDNVDQGAFPYYSKESGIISYSSDGYYKRDLISNGLALQYSGKGYEINSTTSYQYLNDEMNMDQDYTLKDVFQINQRQNQNSLSQEITIKSKNKSWYQWSNGAFGFYDYLKTTPPVYMMKDGIANIIQPSTDKGLEQMMQVDGIPAMVKPMLPTSAKFKDDEIALGGVYRNKSYGGAIFHQSTFNNIIDPGLSVTLGMRLDYEKTELNYNALAQANFDLSGGMLIREPIAMTARPDLKGTISDDFLEFLPKAVIKYDFQDGRGSLYASASRGYKTGGHNIQMFADVLQEALSSDMQAMIMSKTGELALDVIGQMPPGRVPESAIAMLEGFKNMKAEMPAVKDIVSFKPEYSWNYELGGRFDLISNMLSFDFTAFYMDVKDVQVTQFVSKEGRPSGRMITNAGKARSKGVEMELKARPCTGVYLYANYGFADAKFTEYDAGTNADKEEVNYSGNYIPFAPRSTFSVGGTVSYDMKRCTFLDRIALDVNYVGTGKIYWNEANTLSQGFYGVMNAKLSFEKGICSLEVWARNLLDRKYDTFLFTSKDVTRAEDPNDKYANYINYGQRGKPVHFGAAFKVKF